MKVILLKDEKKLGKKGDIIEVSDGHARNYIIPKGIGAPATANNINDLKLQKANAAKVAEEKLEAAKLLADKIAALTVVTSLKTGEGGRAFGSISSKEIAEEFKKQHGIELDKKKIVLEESLKAPGSYKVNVKLHPEVTGVINVEVKEA